MVGSVESGVSSNGFAVVAVVVVDVDVLGVVGAAVGAVGTGCGAAGTVGSRNSLGVFSSSFKEKY